MDVKITPVGGEEVYLDMMPEKIKFGGSGKFMSYSILYLGDVKIPRGSALDEISWSGRFPGGIRQTECFVKSQYFKEPSEYIRLFRTWRDKGIKCRLAITGTGINMDVYVSQFSGSFSGGHGDFDYDVKFVEAQDIVITVKAPEKDSLEPRPDPSGSAAKPSASGDGNTRTYTTTESDTLWRIAQQFLGNGMRYMEIFELNTDRLTHPDILPPGIVLTIPAA